MMRPRTFVWLLLALLVSVSGARVGDARADDVMQRAQARGALVVATAPVPGQMPQAARDSEGQYRGFDVDVSNEIGRRLGLPVRFVSPGWNAVLAGDWKGQWDVAVASITPTEAREQKLIFAGIYRFDAATLVVRKDNTAIERPADASGKRIGVRKGTTFEDYLRRTLVMYNNPNAITYLISDPQIRTYADRDQVVNALLTGQVDAIVTSLALVENDVAAGKPLRTVQGFLFFEPVAVAVDRSDPRFAQQVSDILRAMRTDGTLGTMSEKWFGIDVAGLVP
jgi:polar amino acid transport system substrate-binding protein